MSIEVFSKRRLRPCASLDPHPPASSAPPSLQAGRPARFQASQTASSGGSARKPASAPHPTDDAVSTAWPSATLDREARSWERDRGGGSIAMSIEIFSERPHRSCASLDPHPPAASAPPSLEAGRPARFQASQTASSGGSARKPASAPHPTDDAVSTAWPSTTLDREARSWERDRGGRSIARSDSARGLSQSSGGDEEHPLMKSILLRSRDRDRDRDADAGMWIW
jgi:hypothetical protein